MLQSTCITLHNLSSTPAVFHMFNTLALDVCATAHFVVRGTEWFISVSAIRKRIISICNKKKDHTYSEDIKEEYLVIIMG